MDWTINSNFVESNDLLVEEVIEDMLWDDEYAKEEAYEMYKEMIAF